MLADQQTRALDLLKKLARQPLPVSLTDPVDIEGLAPLKSAGYLIATVSAPQEQPACARVCIITHKGWLALSPRAADRRG